uniref:ribosomal protein S19 n=1 Tax=Dictyotopsis propagulifera TaxID=670095 RepID=UPI002E78B9BE|nr:ribosomal protein S19 [Dictyotopsis propagulifera]WBP69953.1 ribosomal protein S19 [Dictyotopsis propagulifera]
MSRSKWKLPFIDKSLFKLLKSSSQNSIIFSRRSTIYPAFVGKSLKVYNGKNIIKCQIKPEMVGHKLGEFSPTRTKKSFVKKNKL